MNIFGITQEYNFHIFVAISTVIFYIFINKDKNKKKNNFSKIIFVPIILYSTRYLLNLKKTSTELLINNNNNISDELLTYPYPASSSTD